jgi:hypothetical protein
MCCIFKAASDEESDASCSAPHHSATAQSASSGPKNHTDGTPLFYFLSWEKMRDAYPVSMAGPMQHAGIAPLSVRLLLRREFVPMPQHLSPVVSNEVLQIQITEI